MAARKPSPKKKTARKKAAVPHKARPRSGTGSKKGPANPKPEATTRAKGARREAATAFPPPRDIEPEPGFPIVGIGASAGGLEALGTFFKAMPADSGVAFVLVVHLDPTHISILPELLQRQTEMAVHQITDGMQVRPNAVHVIPPNKDLTILNGVLQLMDLSHPRGVNLPIDSFFRALAQDQRRNAVCIILSGTGTDGTLGLKAIKGELGMAMVQDEASAKYDGMPQSAVATGLADYVLPPAKMPDQLIRYVRHAYQKAAAGIVPVQGRLPDALQKVFVILRSRTGQDFSLYKKNTICRRIERRMNVHQIDDIADYVRYLRDSEHEADILFRELLIGVTNFFRDPEAFEVLENKVLPRLLHAKPEAYTLRVWVPGCSSGEEAYSVAILLHEYMDKAKCHFSVQIFGTDIDANAIDVARAGFYPASILADVGPERLKRYFTKEDGGRCRVRKTIREMLVFASQNVIKDPPFTKLDLLCCRNLLIYLGPELQKRLVPLFHYSLRPDGILFLGSSESVGGFGDMFAVQDKRWKIFQRKPAPVTNREMAYFSTNLEGHGEAGPDLPDAVKRAEELSAFQMVSTILQQSDAPPCAIIDDACNVIYIHGRTGRFLEPAEGKVSVNIVEMARPGLKAELAAAIRKVTVHKQAVTVRELCTQDDGGHLSVDLTVRPILEHSAIRGLTMVVFQEVPSPKAPGGKKPKRAAARRPRKSAGELEQELHHTKENLQTTIEELETSNEELKSTNEELQSTNEELQSTNEELETSKEELQSLNEESATVNAELQSRITELATTTDDIKNLLDSIDIAVLFVDADLCIRRFTPRVTDIVPLAGTDTGRPLKHFAVNLVDADLATAAEGVLKDLSVREAEVQSTDGRYYMMRAQPYRTVANVIDGVVLVFVDITERKAAEQGQRRLATVVRDSNDAVTLQSASGRIIAWNRGAERMYGWTEAEALAMNIRDLVPKAARKKALELARRAFRGEEIPPLQTQRVTKDGRALAVWLTMAVVRDSNDKPEFLATTERAVSRSPDIIEGRKVRQ